MTSSRPASEIANELAARKARTIAFWAGVAAPLVGVAVGTYAFYASSGIDDVVPFVLLGGCTFAVGLITRLATTHPVLRRHILGQLATLLVLTAGALGLGSDEWSQTLVGLTAWWFSTMAGSLAGYGLGAGIAARRAERSGGVSGRPSMTDLEKHTLAELEYFTGGWRSARITRTYTENADSGLLIELESRTLADHGYKQVSIDRQGPGAALALAEIVVGNGADPTILTVIYGRTGTDDVPNAGSSPVPTSEWARHDPSRNRK